MNKNNKNKKMMINFFQITTKMKEIKKNIKKYNFNKKKTNTNQIN